MCVWVFFFFQNMYVCICICVCVYAFLYNVYVCLCVSVRGCMYVCRCVSECLYWFMDECGIEPPYSISHGIRVSYLVCVCVYMCMCVYVYLGICLGVLSSYVRMRVFSIIYFRLKIFFIRILWSKKSFCAHYVLVENFLWS